MDLTPTLITGGALAAVALLCGWLGARPPNPHRGPRLVPYRLVMLLAAAGVVIMTVHLVNLLGVTTGR
ncbi:hypothetical protein [Phenylobacterium sp.]|uniref:hypothetical protein n=1 Tax=Phenylobacterium sp. TaxID=1871053 RepID=UPI00260D5FC1|nr:hypothetical protein [Phenylobacterium sp.]